MHDIRLRTRSLHVLGTLLAIAALVAISSPAGFLTRVARAQAPDPCGPPAVNAVACENTQPGTPQSVWDVSGAGGIEGFATDISVNRGDTVHFKINTAASSYRVDIYRLGYYGGDGARFVATVNPSVTLPQVQPACDTNPATGLIDCGSWGESASWSVPSTAVSGIYLAKLVRTDGTAGDAHIPFIVRDDGGHAAMLFQTSDTTWQAYNTYGGNSLYVGGPATDPGRAYEVSYNRPFTTRETTPEDYLFNAEYPMVRWLEANGYDVAYSTGVDADRRGAELLNHKVVLSVGHDEYWSGNQRANLEAARAAGVNLAFFSGNEVFWKIRWTPSITAPVTDYRTITCYKETHANAKIDPDPSWTGTWRDPRFSPPSDGGRPENALTGTIFTVNDAGNSSLAITVPSTFSAMRFWRNTSIASLAPGTTATLGAGTLGYEWDEPLANGFQPAGLLKLSSTTVAVPQKLLDYGSTYGTGTATHALTLYRDPTSNALVFGAGTVQWSWGLDADHDRGPAADNADMKQATANLFTDMGVQPATPQGGLVISSASSDVSAPAASITSPAPGTTVLTGVATTISGTASDVGGTVAAVEVSADGGATWAPASGTTSWSYSWTPTAAGTASLVARATDDSGNMGLSGSVSVTVGDSLPASCPCSLWNDTVVPPIPDAGPDSAVELGVKFVPSADGFIKALKFYKSEANTGVHTGSLWGPDGSLLATVTFTNETASGWQTQVLGTPVPVTANTTYTASYHVTGGHYSFASNFFTNAYTTGPLTAPADSTTPNGVFVYGDGGRAPTFSYNAGNYWVDVVYDSDTTDTTAPTVISVSPTPSATNVEVNAPVTATFSESMDASTVNSSTLELRDASNAIVNSTVSYDSVSHVATLTPTTPLTLGGTYTVRIRGGATDPRVKDTAGNPLAADFTWSFTIASDTTPPTVTSVTPASGATGLPVDTAVTATFSEAVDPATVSGATILLKNASNTTVAASVSYNTATQTTTLTPTAALAASSIYTATVKGGSAGVKDTAGNPLAADFTWSFTTGAGAPSGCPCSLWPDAATPAMVDSGDNSAVEVGVKFQSDAGGYITAIRFYKSVANTGTHTGHLWTASGTLLGTVTFTNETASGWQTASFSSPIAITAGTTYVASYFAPLGRYSANGAYFLGPYTNAPLTAPATSTTPNGVYRYGGTGFPTQTYNAANYWVDVVYSTTPGGADTTPPTVSSTAPTTGATGVLVSTAVTATFSESLDAATISTSTFELRDSTNTLVPSTVAWNAGTRTATLQPNAPLAYQSTYTARVKGGSAGVKDLAGNAMAADYTWVFTTGAAATQDPNNGPGGPVLIVTDPSNPYGRFYAEILRAQGLNEFAVADLANVNATALAGYDVVLLANVPLTPAQVTMFTNWANSGGNLIAMRPDPQLASLLGLAAGGSTLSNGYLLINTAQAPGAGLVDQTIQFHGTADEYTLNGATSVATLYSDATTATSSPAVTIRKLSGNGGTVAAFTFDLARSVALTRQGNPDWARQERDGITPVRSDDLFFGASVTDPQPDWVDLSKVAIPQADEQMRLLSKMVVQANLSRRPLPQFWFLPRGLKAAVVMTGDDHAHGGFVQRMQNFAAVSPSGCSVDDWQCVRSTAYVYPTATVTDADVASLVAQGFEVAAHINTECRDFNQTSLTTTFDQQFADFAATYPSAGAPSTNRTHCIVWSDWASEPRVELAHGVRLDTTYYYWPDTWIQDRPGMFTGSGMPMRFTDETGAMIDVYQAATQMTDESGQTYPKNIDTLLDNALGPNGFYGVFTANMHSDEVDSPGANAIVSSALSRGVPIVSAKQMLTWLDARNGSSFGSLVWTTGQAGAPQGGSTLAFTVTAAAGANGLQAMLPRTLAGGVGVITSLTRNGSPVALTIANIKGVDYATFSADSGSYVATYDTTAPNTTLTATPPVATTSTSATFQFTSTEAGSTFACRVDGGTYTACTSPLGVSGLANGTHTFNVRATDLAGNTDASAAAFTWSIDTTPPTVVSRTPAPNAIGVALNAAVTVQFSEPIATATVSNATFSIRRSGASTDLAATVSASGSTATLVPSVPFVIGTVYEVTVGSGITDLAGNPLGADSVWTFTAQGTIVDTTAADFAAGTPGTGTSITQSGNGEVMLTPTVGSEFGGTALEAGWTATAWVSGGSAGVAGGVVTIDSARVNTTLTYPAGRALDFAATFGNQPYQHAGFGVTLEQAPYAIFSTGGGGGGLFAITNSGPSQLVTSLSPSLIGSSHTYRIEWNASSVVYFVDGVQVASHAIAIATAMRPIASDYVTGAPYLVINWMRMSPYSTNGSFVSRVIDGAATIAWGTASWTADVPAGTSVLVEVRTGNTATPDGTWTGWTTIASSGGAVGSSSRYLQYRLTLTSTGAASPAVKSVTFTGSLP